MRHPFLRLIGKELRQSAGVTLSTAGLFGLGFLLLAYLQRHPTQFVTVEFVRSLSLTPVVALPFWTIWRAMAGWNAEWKGKHVHLVLMLPAPGWWLVLSRTIAVVVETMLCAAIAAAGFLAINWENMQVPAHGWALLDQEPLVLIMVLSLIFCLAVIAQFAALAGRLAHRFGGWLAAVALLTSGWALIRFAGLTGRLLGWVPPWSVAWCEAQGWETSCKWHWSFVRTPGLFAALLGAVLLLWISAWLIDRHVEA